MNDDDDEDADDEDRIDTINLLIKFLLKLIKDVFIFPNNEFVNKLLIIKIKCLFLFKDSVDIIYNCKHLLKYFVCWKFRKFFIVLHRRIM
jgi:hypothetical protein